MRKYFNLILSIFFIIAAIAIEPIFTFLSDLINYKFTFIIQQKSNFIVIGITLLSVSLIKLGKAKLLNRYDIEAEDNLHSRKLYTQVNILEKVIVTLIIIVAIGLILLSFDGIRKIGIGLFASAGVAGIIIGLSAQKVFGALLAGIQIAITQPFRIDDAVLVENEWGWIEEINLTYIVVRIWDKRRLVLPSTYFLEKPFQNWTRTSGDIIGTVFLYTDYTIPFESLREELTRVLNTTDLWDKKVNVLQVTDSKEHTVESRILVSAKNSPTCWDLRVYVREKMIEFIQKNYPESLPKARLMVKSDKKLVNS
ncbi:mechanosensitive ion channel family protein [Psychroflexus sp. MBR-150]|jgi:small-conductance mechanosensitive channel